MIYLLIGYMWLFIHRPFEIWLWIAPLRIEFFYVLFCLVYWLMQPKTWLPARSHLPVCILATTLLAASQLSPYATWATVDDWFKVLVFYVLAVTSIHTKHDLKHLVIGFTIIMALYELHSLREYLNGKGVYRMGTWRMVGVGETLSDPNSFGASVNYALPFLLPTWYAATEKWQKLAVVLMFGIGVLCILLTGSRSNFAVLLVVGTVAALCSKYRWYFVIVLAILPPIIWASLRPDLRDRYTTLLDPSQGPANAQVSAEGRSESFWAGMQSFAENPIFGAGLGSYRATRGYATHNLYNQAMGELGIFGLIVLIGFAWVFSADFVETRQFVLEASSSEQIFLKSIIVAACFSCILLFMLGWGAHNLTRHNWLWFGAFSGAAVYFIRHAPNEDVENLS